MPTVLIIEDDPAVRMLLGELLRMRGLDVREEATGDHALEAVRRERPDLVLLDIGLPGVHGLTVLDQLKATPELMAIPVVIISAWKVDSLIERIITSGASDFLAKPLENSELIGAVERCLTASRISDRTPIAA